MARWSVRCWRGGASAVRRAVMLSQVLSVAGGLGACASTALLLWGGLLSLSAAFELPAMAAGDDAELVEPALQRAVPERDAARGLEADQLRQAQIGSKHVAAPAGESLL